MKIGWYVGCTALTSLIGFGSFCAMLLPQVLLPPRTAQAVQVIQSQESSSGFPFRISDTTLVAEALAKYEGNTIETDSDAFLVDAAALELRNTGQQEILTAQIQLTFELGTMTFFGTNIPAGERVLIVEQTGKPWTGQSITGYSSRVQYETEMTWDSELTVAEIDKTTLAVTNTSDHVKKDIWLYYKEYLSDSDLYVGGITYVYQIAEIQPGETVQIRPDKYVSGYSRVIKLVSLEP